MIVSFSGTHIRGVKRVRVTRAHKFPEGDRGIRGRVRTRGQRSTRVVRAFVSIATNTTHLSGIVLLGGQTIGESMPGGFACASEPPNGDLRVIECVKTIGCGITRVSQTFFNHAILGGSAVIECLGGHSVWEKSTRKASTLKSVGIDGRVRRRLGTS